MNRYDAIGAALIAALLGFVALMAGVAYSVTRPKPVDHKTLCPTDRIVSHTVLLVDRTDPLGKEGDHLLQSTFERIVASLARDERFSIFIIDSNGSKAPPVLFSRCAPSDGDDAHWLYENRRLINRHWKRAFVEPVGIVALRLREPAQASLSPIMETIQAVTRLPTFSPSIGDRTLVIASDFLQNVPAYSHYRSLPDYESFRKSLYAATVETDLTDVKVELVYLPNPKAGSRQTDEHRHFWLRYVSESGAGQMRLTEYELRSHDELLEQCCG